MNIEEYNKVEPLNYDEYCDYLKNKYGKPVKAYFTEGYGKTRISRTGEGLFVHHIKEDTAIQLSVVAFAKKNPYEYQLPENLVYCDYLEHLLLHAKICLKRYPDMLNLLAERKKNNLRGPIQVLGIRGISCFLIPILNDIYSGYESSLAWQKSCADKVRNDKEVYIEILKYIQKNLKKYPLVSDSMFYSSNNLNQGYWSTSGKVLEHNEPLYKEIAKALHHKHRIYQEAISNKACEIGFLLDFKAGLL